MKKIRLISLLAVLLFTAAVAGNCGYRLSGFGKQVPDHIRTVVIPDFENKTTRLQAEQFVTFAVKDEFIARSDLVLVNTRDEADAVLEGEIVSFNVTPVSITDEGSASLYKLSIVLSVRFIDLKNNNIIFEGKSIGFNDTYDFGDYEVDGMDFFSQETEKLSEIAERFAESVVTTILENF
ncbi:MAG: LptE family protein [bacterium]|nr:LptE family protein [bacterium]